MSLEVRNEEPFPVYASWRAADGTVRCAASATSAPAAAAYRVEAGASKVIPGVDGAACVFLGRGRGLAERPLECARPGQSKVTLRGRLGSGRTAASLWVLLAVAAAVCAVSGLACAWHLYRPERQ